jgi:hypothetical protein
MAVNADRISTRQIEKRKERKMGRPACPPAERLMCEDTTSRSFEAFEERVRVEGWNPGPGDPPAQRN